MPQRSVHYPHEVNHIQVLDENGEVDKDLEPGIPDDDLTKLHRTMVLIRLYDEARLRLQRQGEIGTFAPVTGQEAAQLGSIYALREQDWFVPSFRELACAVWRGLKLEDDLLYVAGYEEGIQIPDGAHDLPIAIPIGTQICHGAGVAWASKLRGLDEVTISYIGDGGTSEGDFHEGMNFAGVYNVPLIVFIQNNQWAISVPRNAQTRSTTLAQKAYAYGFPGVQVDGNDILGVYRVTKWAWDRARDGEGPTLVEAITYRMGVHTTADDPKKYRSDAEVDQWKARDPIDRFQKYLIARGLLDEDEVAGVRDDAKRQVKKAIERFRANLPDTFDTVFAHHMEKLPAYTRRQKEELLEYAQRAELAVGGH